MNVLSARDLAVGYNGEGVVSGVNIEAMRGNVICLIGPNGAGKSTILRTLSGLLSPVGGAVAICGCDLRKMKGNERAKTLSVVLTDRVNANLTTVFELVSMGRMPYTGLGGRLSREDIEITEGALSDVGALPLAGRFFSELSDGERQKVMIARAIVQQPQLIILDEPTSHLDIKHKTEVIRILRRLAREKGITVIMSLHDIDMAIKGCDRLILVEDGAVSAQGNSAETAGNGVINRLYGIEGAEYNEQLGMFEFRGRSGREVFVTGGASTGIAVYRALAAANIAFCCGILHENDCDFTVGKMICGEVFSEKPFCEISDESAENVFSQVKGASAVIDTGFPVGSGNVANIMLLKKLIAGGARVFSLRNREAFELLFGSAENIAFFKTAAELISELSKSVILPHVKP